jgi:transposase-like protein
MMIPEHIRNEIAAIERAQTPLDELASIGAVREWLREAELRAIQDAREGGQTLARIGDALGTDRQQVHQKLNTASKIKGLTDPAFDGVGAGTLRYWLRWWSDSERSPFGAEEKGRDPATEAARVRNELEAREKAGLLKKPVEGVLRKPN